MKLTTLVLIKNTGESIRVQNFFAYDDNKLDRVQFADGTRWDRATLLAQEMNFVGGGGDDVAEQDIGTIFSAIGAANAGGGCVRTDQRRALALLEQSYAQLKQSVYDGLVSQRWLKPYLDRAMNESEWRKVA